MSSSQHITLHLGSRLPKKYERDSDPQHPQLSEDQPGELKCRIKIRMAPSSTLPQGMAELQRCWAALDHGPAPAWVAGTDPLWVQMASQMFGGVPIREWQPSEGDE